LQFEKVPLSDYYVSRCLTSGRTDLAVEALRREVKDMKKWMESEYRAPRGAVGGYRQPMVTRHTAPSIYSGVLSVPLSPHGPHPASHGNRPNFTRTTNEDGMGRNDHSYRIPRSNFRCFNCGSPAHRARECPIPSVERSWPEQQPALLLIRRPPNVRPLKSRIGKRDLTCIKARYRQYELSALIDTGSDVSIAGEDIARDLGWTIYKHRTTEVSIANNKTMSILGATRVVLIVAGRGVESEILIAPDLDGLILGVNWLHSQGRIRWDFDQGKIKFGKQRWIKLQPEAEQPYWASMRKGFPTTDRRIGTDRSDFHAAPTGSARRFCCSKLHQALFREVSLFCRIMHQVESERGRHKSHSRELKQCISDIRRRMRDEVLAALSRCPTCLLDLWASYMIVRGARRVLGILLHFHPSSTEEASAGGDVEVGGNLATFKHFKELQNDEDKTPGMSSAIRMVSPQRDGILAGPVYSSLSGKGPLDRKTNRRRGPA